MAEKLKLDYKKTLLIGFGFMATSIAWAIYDPYVSKLLSELLTKSDYVSDLSTRLATNVPFLLKLMEAQEGKGAAGAGFTLVPLFVGIIMTFDNVFGVIFQPLFGKLSDRTHSRFGKRRPFIFVGAPLAAVFFVLIPRMQTIPALMICVILYVFIMSTWRAPVVALMPDLTPPVLRSEGNAIINLTGGIGGLIGMFAGTLLALVFGFNKDLNEERPFVFVLGACVMILGTLVLAFFVKEPDSRLQKIADYAKEGGFDKDEAKKKEKAKLKAMKLGKAEKRSLIFMLGALFFHFAGANSIQTFFALFADEILGKSTADATLMLGVFGLAAMAAAIPAGKLGTKYGRKKMIMTGLAGFIVMFVLYALTKQMWLMWPALIIGGVANMFITVNTLPLVLEIGGLEKVGTFTGYYYTATFSAQVAAPILYGVVRVLSGTYMSLFVFCPIAFALSLLCIWQVRHGEAIPESVIKEAEMQDA